MQKFESTKDVESDGLKYNLIKMNALQLRPSRSSADQKRNTDGSLQLLEHNDRNPFMMVRRASTRDYLVTLHGLTRVKLLGPTPSHRSQPFTTLSLHTISYASASPPDSEQIDPASLANFKQSALTLLDRLARDPAQKVRREAYIKISEMLDDLDLHSSSSESVSRAAWMADTLVGSVVNDYNDRLGKLLSLLLASSI